MAETDPDKILTAPQLLALERFLRRERTENRRVIFASLAGFVSLVSLVGGFLIYTWRDSFDQTRTSVLELARLEASATVEEELRKIEGLQKKAQDAVADAIRESGRVLAVASLQTTQLDTLSTRIVSLETTAKRGAPLIEAISKAESIEAFVNTPQFKDEIARRVNPLPKGIVVVSSIPCTNLSGDWSEFSALSGRFPIGVGSATDARGEARTFRPNDSGGEYAHQLTISEMPSHNHENGKFTYLLMSDGNFTERSSDQTAGQPNLVAKGAIKEQGGDQAHNNVPPYLAVFFCQRD